MYFLFFLSQVLLPIGSSFTHTFVSETNQAAQPINICCYNKKIVLIYEKMPLSF